MRFLIIDDDLDKVEFLASQLGEEDTYTLKKCFNTGMKELYDNKDKYDCLFLDMNFPQLLGTAPKSKLGLEFLRRLKRKNINIPIVVYSSMYVNTSEYENVIDYYIYDGHSLSNRIMSLKNKLESRI